MTFSITHALHLPGPRYLAIADTVQRAINLSELLPGDRLPTHREMAQQLNVDVGTITRAYAELKRRGLIAGEVGRGSFIRHPKAEAPDTLGTAMGERFIDLSHNFPSSSPQNPELRDMAEALRGQFDLPSLMSFQADVGHALHRAEIARWLAGFGMDAAPADIVLTAGAQHALLLALQATTEAGDIVLAERHTYYGAISACSMLGRTIEGVDTDDQGLLPQALDAACRRTGSKVLYCMPTLQNPTTATMSRDRREAIVQVCKKHDVTIIEDDVYAFLLTEPLPTLWSYLPKQTLYISSLSKIVGPGLRVGFVATPRQWQGRIGAALRSTTLMAPALMVELSTRLMRDGVMARMASARREQARDRQRWARAILPPERAVTHPEAFHIWLKTGPSWSSTDFAAVARERGVGVAAGNLFSLDPARRENAVRICVSAASDQAALTTALGTLMELLTDGPLLGGALV
ncbi:aminotransferase-like domain-containing protein [Pseudomonas gingeri]|uniref:PLP-dependent aminotransferase family protein n=1 Tax=Pseudomonas gingeri TaxID=117681 RepID=A0A7Y7YFU8_9PSED|nr:PLP-dependent aminotransferase family protein [Pseudomonas gingeri]NVZ99176.1 PLP-dependent aminotransferase family protein [Pseudomonas gingeri]NWA13221.1 PLP-dependent aminotransferase family protein [Pseudomonas gingeri]NWA55482.1 PLP-dependent aminotransferase family protein [Pseudomonas gingeri]NWA95664.1 PLP-dependent aminotransferase family protein [Pseudomonas gingeri]NWB00751.1 PLP-dependent aminotransferase family protein [Pseudomonas gingeri]